VGRQLRQARNRLDVALARFDTKAWVMARRIRTRHLIELGGLVQKAGLVHLTDDDRAMLYGAFLDVAARMQGEDGAALRGLLRRRGLRAFADEAEVAKPSRATAAGQNMIGRKGKDRPSP